MIMDRYLVPVLEGMPDKMLSGNENVRKWKVGCRRNPYDFRIGYLYVMRTPTNS